MPLRSSRAGLAAGGLALLTVGVLITPGVAGLNVAAAFPSPLPGLPAPSLVQPPPPAPGLPAGPCRMDSLGATEIRTIFSLPVPSGGELVYPSVNPWAPCRIYRSFANHVDRSDDTGNHFQRALSFGPGSGVIQGTPRLGSARIVGADNVYVPDEGVYDGVVYTADSGAGWQHRDVGLPATSGTGGFAGLAAIAFAPSDPNVAYAAYATTGTSTDAIDFYRTRDGGQSWVRTANPAGSVLDIAIDPNDPNHVFVSGTLSANTSSAPGAVFASTDGGANWSARGVPGGAFNRLWAARPGGVLVLFGQGLPVLPASGSVCISTCLTTGSAVALLRSIDGAANWTEVPGLVADSSGHADLAVNPLDPEEMAWAFVAPNGRVAVANTVNAFATVQSVEAFPPLFTGVVSYLKLSFDRNHQLFMGLRYDTGREARDVLYAFRPRTLHLFQFPAFPNLPSGGNSQSVAECTLDSLPAAALAIRGIVGNGSAPNSGSIAFDGRYLDYGEDSQDPGVIHRVDPTGCVAAPPIRAAIPPNGGSAGSFWSLTFDPLYAFPNGDLGALLLYGIYNADSRVQGLTPVYAVNLRSGETVLTGGIPTSCRSDPTIFTYDYHLNRIWAAGGTCGTVNPMRFPASVGQFTPDPTCMSASPNNSNNQYTATWTVGSPNIMYIEAEDDATVTRWDSARCAPLSSFAHPSFSEAGDENEQMACDAITFGDKARPRSSGPLTSVLWIRDASANVARAYSIPDGNCPFPTTVSVSNVTAVVDSPIELCATLNPAAVTDATAVGLEQLDFQLSGSPVNGAVTGLDGQACVSARVPSRVGNYPINASFSGSRAYLPSAGGGTLTAVYGAVKPLLPATRAGGILPPVHSRPLIENPSESQALARQAVPNAQPVTQPNAALMTQQQQQAQLATNKERTVARRRQRETVTPEEKQAVLYAVALVFAVASAVWAFARSPVPAGWRRI